jgi:two-component system, NtrC family, sensor kinase
MQQRGSRRPGKRQRVGEPKALKPSQRTIADLQEQLAGRTRERNEALEQQAATSEILKVISHSTFELQTVLATLVRSAGQLCRAENVQIFLRDGEVYRLVADNGFSPEYQQYAREHPIRPGRNTLVARTALWGKTVHIHDSLADPEYTYGGQKLGGYRTMLGVPLIRDGNCIGVIALTRSKVHPFTDNQIELVTNFGAQAVIAIENTRLVGELRESLQQQTATADVLKVISRSTFDLQKVLDTLTESVCRLCDAYDAIILLCEGDYLRIAAHYGEIPVVDKWPISRDWISGRCVVDRKPIYVHDLMAEEAEFPKAHAFAQQTGHRTLFAVPLLRDQEVIGAINIRRTEVRPFTDKQIELVSTFADQAVIAIENARLFNEVQERTVELSEALEQQTATAEVLSVISSSTGDLAPVFETMLGKAMELCGASFGVLSTFDGSRVHTAATYGLPPAYEEYRRTQHSLEYGPGTGLYRLLQGEPFAEIEDLVGSEPYVRGDPNRRALVDLGGARCLLTVPLLKDDRIVGFIMIFRQERKRFSQKQITLLQQFAAQAVIAIENTRLLKELRQRTDDLTEALVYQTGSSNILKVIASSPTDVEPALKAIVESACEICGAYDALVFLKDGSDLVFAAHHGPIPIELERWPINRKWITGRTLVDKAPQHIHDIYGPEGDDFPEGRELARHQGLRTVLSVPLLREGDAIGVIGLRSVEVQPFNDKQIELLKSFADQAVIAISNVRLFEQVQERTRELSRSLDDLRTAQDRLIQTEKLASLGQLTAGIAHEIKNPLNFVNNFSALSVELTDELKDVLNQVDLAEKIRQEVGELTQMLTSNLEKVVQHGKRADSIVKNMLLHSREGSGEHRPVEINAIIDESLNLAYHGARAEGRNFNISLERDFDPAVGAADIYPQEITRVLLNLISNGFYAATQRVGTARDGFEPRLKAITRNLGDKVELRIRDNGAGITPDIQEKIFNPFFTTKPAGEGTGLGLSMSHDIVVKQHGGTIEVLTEPGSFTEFVIRLPRVMAAQPESGGQRK